MINVAKAVGVSSIDGFLVYLSIDHSASRLMKCTGYKKGKKMITTLRTINFKDVYRCRTVNGCSSK